jgi:hypothetical protein
MSTPNPSVVYRTTSLADVQALVSGITSRCPALTERATKAALILVSGKCRPVRPDIFAVDGNDAQPYAVDLTAAACGCPDFHYRAPELNGSKWCKHLVAALFLATLSQQPAAGLVRVRGYTRRLPGGQGES